MKPNNEIVAELIIGGLLRSLNYDAPDGGETFADAGTEIDLNNGDITSTGLVVDGTTGALFVRGSITASSFTILDGLSFPRIVAGSTSLAPIGGTAFGLIYDDSAFADPDTAAGVVFNGGAIPETSRAALFATAPDGSDGVVAATAGNSGIETLMSSVDGSSGNGAAVTVSGTDTVARIRLNAVGGPAAGEILLEATLVRLDALGSIVLDANADVVVEGTQTVRFATGGGGWFMSDTTWIRAYGNKNVYTGGEIRAGSKFSFTNGGYVFTQETDTDTGLYYDADGDISIVTNGTRRFRFSGGFIYMLENEMRLRGIGDGNHILKWTNATPTGSGSASDGPLLQGFGSVWLKAVNGDCNLFLLATTGNVFIDAGASYTNFSSRELKRNVEPIDPAAALADVLAWRPVEFDYIDKGRHADGFIAEDLFTVSPQLVTVRQPGEDREGWPYAIAYAEAVPRLAAAVQGLALELAELRRGGRR